MAVHRRGLTYKMFLFIAVSIHFIIDLSSTKVFADSSDIVPGMFSEEEKKLHLENIEIITSQAAECLYRTANEQLEFFNSHGVTKFYGDRNPKYETLSKRREALIKLGKNPALADQQQAISCIGLTRTCLSEGFAAADLRLLWAKIDKRLAKDKSYDGTDLQKMLHLLGWKILYWNPDPSQNALWDIEDRKINPLTKGRKWMGVWGGHAENYSSVMKKGTYYGVPVDDAETLVGFKDQAPDELAKADFFVGTAHSGYHVFPGYSGNVIEGHSMRSLDSKDNIEVSTFNPLGSGGGPRWTRTERYRSGIIAVPPPKK